VKKTFICSANEATHPNVTSVGHEKCAHILRFFDKYAVIINIGAIFEDLIEIFFLKKYDYLIFHIIVLPMLFIAALLFMIICRYSIHIKPYKLLYIQIKYVYISRLAPFFRRKLNPSVYQCALQVELKYCV
jgi:Na+/serine symporter